MPFNPGTLAPGFGRGITVRNVNDALPLGLQLLKQVGVETMTRNGPVLRAPGPVFTIYECPTERVLIDSERDANPFFHLMESLWILAGSNHVALPSYFLKSILNYSDDGKTFHGAYGYRLRHWWGNSSSGFDQLAAAIKLLRENPTTRQAVCSIWDPLLDLGNLTKDMPCNDMLMFDIVDGALNMTVCNRSNDVIWGAYGANAVQFSFIQEFVAASVGVDVGYYTQMSNNYHVYLENDYWKKWLAGESDFADVYNPYESRLGDDVMQLAESPDEALQVQRDCELLDRMAQGDLMSNVVISGKEYFLSPYFRDVVLPMVSAYMCYKAGDFTRAIGWTDRIQSSDWQFAAVNWLQRRQIKRAG